MVQRLSNEGVVGGPLPYLAVASGATLFSGLIVASRAMSQRGFSLYEISLSGILFGSLVFGAVLVARPSLRPRRRDRGLFLAYGLVGAVLQLSQFAGVVLGVPIALVGLLLYTQPIWTLLFGRILLAEPVTRRKVGALGLAAAGTLVLFQPAVSGLDHSWIGLLASLVGGVMLSLWLILGRISGLRGNAPITTAFAYMASSSLILLLAWILLRLTLGPVGWSRLSPVPFLVHWRLVALYTLFANLVPAILVNWGIRRIDTTMAGMLLLVEPVAAAWAAYLAFGEVLDGSVWLGGTLILAGNVVLLSAGKGVGRGANTGRSPDS